MMMHASNPMVPTKPASKSDARCWKRTSAAWATVPAPWGDQNPMDWLCGQNKRLVFRSNPSGDENAANPILSVYAVGDTNPSDPAALLVCELSGGEARPVQYTQDSAALVLCEWPALPRVVAEYGPLLKFFQN